MTPKRAVFTTWAIALALLSGCATQSTHRETAPVPRSAQYTLTSDWVYPIKLGFGKYLGSYPLELGAVAAQNGVTYVASSLGRVIAIDESNVKPLWDISLDMPVTAGPVLTAQAVYVALSNGAVVKLKRTTGDEIWRFSTGAAVENSLSVTDGIVSCVNANNRIFALDERTGSLIWRRERPRSNEFSMYGQPSPLIVDNTVYAGFSDGFFVAYNQTNGTALFTRELAPKARFKDLDVQPVKVGNAIYVASSSGGLYALAADDGKTLWQRDIFGISSIRAFQDSLYVSSQSGIFRLRKNTGETIWQNIIRDGALISPIALGKRYIYASVQKFGLVILDRIEGDTLHIIDNGSDFTSAPLLQNGALTLLSNRSTVYRYTVDDTPI